MNQFTREDYSGPESSSREQMFVNKYESWRYFLFGGLHESAKLEMILEWDIIKFYFVLGQKLLYFLWSFLDYK